jgi:hypothetical protein
LGAESVPGVWERVLFGSKSVPTVWRYFVWSCEYVKIEAFAKIVFAKLKTSESMFWFWVGLFFFSR